MTTPTPSRRLLAAIAATSLIALVGACSSGGAGDSASQASADSAAGADLSGAADAPEADVLAYDSGGSGTGRGAATSDTSSAVGEQAPGDAQALIRTGTVALRSDDVPAARFDVGKVIDAHGGEVAEESTQADEAGEAERVRLVLRVPVAEFDATMTGLRGVADLLDVTTDSQDVTTDVIDTDVRVELQKRSIERIGTLLDSATDLRDVISIERELASREADLGSLEKRQAYLADQTQLATITVSIEPLPEGPARATVEEDDGFLAGLAGGWRALGAVTTSVLTVAGAVLPFALVLLLLALPGRLLVRRLAPRA